MWLEDNVATTTPTHILLKVDDVPKVAFSITYPEGEVIDEIELEYVCAADISYSKDELHDYIWCISFLMMPPSNDIYLRMDDLGLTNLRPRPVCPNCNEWFCDNNVEAIEYEDNQETVELTDITEAEYETMHVIADIPLLHVEITEFGIVEVWLPREDLRNEEQKRTYAANRLAALK